MPHKYYLLSVIIIIIIIQQTSVGLPTCARHHTNHRVQRGARCGAGTRKAGDRWEPMKAMHTKETLHTVWSGLLSLSLEVVIVINKCNRVSLVLWWNHSLSAFPLASFFHPWYLPSPLSHFQCCQHQRPNCSPTSLKLPPMPNLVFLPLAALI